MSAARREPGPAPPETCSARSEQAFQKTEAMSAASNAFGSTAAKAPQRTESMQPVPVTSGRERAAAGYGGGAAAVRDYVLLAGEQHGAAVGRGELRGDGGAGLPVGVPGAVHALFAPGEAEQGARLG